MTTQPPREPIEFRVGIVFYGGVSLAVYMGGVAQEFLRAARASKAGPENPYQPLLSLLNGRLVIDVLAGTSAGGVNATFLARALATGGKLDHLGKLWRDDGDFARLLDWGDQPPGSPLNGDTFLASLRSAMAEVYPNETPHPDVAVLDLFVTATDLFGKYGQFPLATGQPIAIRDHAHQFHLKLRQEFNLGEIDAKPLGHEQNDFMDPVRLAHICRSTAAFPGAFSPSLWDTDDVYAGTEPPSGAKPTKVWLADGAILVNHPFAPVLQTIAHRGADTPVERLLFYVDPNPTDLDVPATPMDPAEPNPFESLIAGAVDIPMYQGIGDYLRTIVEHNRQVAVLQQVMTALELDQTPSPALTPAYLALRYGELRDFFKANLRQRLINQGVAPTDALDQLDRWVSTNMPPTCTIEAMLAFLEAHDLPFEQRRLHHLVQQLGQGATCGLPADTLRSQRIQLWRALESLAKEEWLLANWDPLRPEQRALPFTLPDMSAWRQGNELDLAPELQPIYDGYTQRDSLLFPLVLGTSLTEIKPISLARVSPYDATRLLAKNPTADQIRSFALGKVAGRTMSAFGGFLSWRWRENDYLWGRLDAADALISNLVERAERMGYDMVTVNRIADECFEAACRQILATSLGTADLTRLTSVVAAENQRKLPDLITGLKGLQAQMSQAGVAGPEMDLLRQWEQSLGQVAAGTQIQTSPGSPSHRAWLESLVNMVDWSRVQTFLTQELKTGGESIAALSPAVLVNDALDFVHNTQSIITGLMAKAIHPAPKPIVAGTKVITTVIATTRTFVRTFWPRPAIGEDDRPKTGWSRTWLLLPLLALYALAKQPATIALLALTLLVVSLLLTLAVAAIHQPFRAWLINRVRRLPPLSAPTYVTAFVLLLFAYVPQGARLPGGVTVQGGAGTVGLGIVSVGLVASLMSLVLGTRSATKQQVGWRGRIMRIVIAASIPVVLIIGLVAFYNYTLQLPVAPVAKVETFPLPPGSGAPEGIARSDSALLIATLDGYLVHGTLRTAQTGALTPLTLDAPLAKLPEGAATGIASDGGAGFFVAGQGGVYHWDGASAGVTAEVRLPGSPNGIIGSGEDLYVSTFPQGMGVWHIRQAHPLIVERLPGTLVGASWYGPNGLAIRQVDAKRFLVVAESLTGRILQVELNAQGATTGAPVVLARLPIGSGPDGVLPLAGHGGQIAISTNDGYIYFIDPVKRQVVNRIQIDDPNLAPANLVQEGDTLWFAGVGRLHLWDLLRGRSPFRGARIGRVTIP